MARGVPPQRLLVAWAAPVVLATLGLLLAARARVESLSAERDDLEAQVRDRLQAAEAERDQARAPARPYDLSLR